MRMGIQRKIVSRVDGCPAREQGEDLPACGRAQEIRLLGARTGEVISSLPDWTPTMWSMRMKTANLPKNGQNTELENIYT